jgi:hypothetical protein
VSVAARRPGQTNKGNRNISRVCHAFDFAFATLKCTGTVLPDTGQADKFHFYDKPCLIAPPGRAPPWPSPASRAPSLVSRRVSRSRDAAQHRLHYNIPTGSSFHVIDYCATTGAVIAQRRATPTGALGAAVKHGYVSSTAKFRIQTDSRVFARTAQFTNFVYRTNKSNLCELKAMFDPLATLRRCAVWLQSFPSARTL